MAKTRVLFLCRHNAVRSQMAETLLRARFPEQYEAESAGMAPTSVHPLAVRVLKEAGVSTNGLRSKHVEELSGRSFDFVVTVCGQDDPTCPFFAGGQQIHKAFLDPSEVGESDEDRLAAFRATRDEIDAWIKNQFGQVAQGMLRSQRGSAPWVQRSLASLLEQGEGAVERALAEDEATSDVTSAAALGRGNLITAVLQAKASGILAGLPVAVRVFQLVDPTIRVTLLAVDGQDLASGDPLAEIRGPAAAILAAERTALNFLQRMSGIATATNRYVDAVARTKALVLDTRKTAPGLRALDKYAVRIGGGTNHRMSLGDLVLVKDNHADAGGGLLEAVKRIRSLRPEVPIEVEVRSLDELELVLTLVPLPDGVLFDNLSLESLREAVARVGERTWTEASGGVTLETVADIAGTGVDAISVGALTHSVVALDISLDVLDPAARTPDAVRDARRLREKLGARVLILAHHYVRDEILPFADVRGDSLELARAAAASDAETILLCGVRFMGETAATLARQGQRVLLPRTDLGCYLADCAGYEDVRAAWKTISACGTAIPLAYVNSSLAIKAFCGERGGATCTSSNAPSMLRWALDTADRVLFLPDRNLALNTAAALRLAEREVLVWDPAVSAPREEIERARLVVWPGACCVHRRFHPRHVTEVRLRLPKARVLVHPECDPAVARAADAIGSTGQMVRWIDESPSGSVWAVGTEQRLVSRLAAAHPDKTVVGLADVPSFCSSMGRIRLDDLANLLHALDRGEQPNRVDVKPSLATTARGAVMRMLGKGSAQEGVGGRKA